tara:strand:- start:2283 stop:2507 length:225 start_codon:yes stop_codon:yes gene_type:complete
MKELLEDKAFGYHNQPFTVVKLSDAQEIEQENEELIGLLKESRPFMKIAKDELSCVGLKLYKNLSNRINKKLKP